MPITDYALLLDRCGLSHREAADFHDVRLDTVKSWASGRSRRPDRVIDDLCDLYRKIALAADQALKAAQELDAKHGQAAEIELGLATTDEEAQTLGWPNVGAQRAVFGLIIANARGLSFAVVPRGSTPSTAAARNARAGDMGKKT